MQTKSGEWDLVFMDTLHNKEFDAIMYNQCLKEHKRAKDHIGEPTSRDLYTITTQWYKLWLLFDALDYNALLRSYYRAWNQHLLYWYVSCIS